MRKQKGGKNDGRGEEGNHPLVPNGMEEEQQQQRAEVAATPLESKYHAKTTNMRVNEQK